VTGNIGTATSSMMHAYNNREMEASEEANLQDGGAQSILNEAVLQAQGLSSLQAHGKYKSGSLSASSLMTFMGLTKQK
jgi:hypothetical protein